MEKIFNGDIPCYDCGTKENPVWSTDSIFWNETMGKKDRMRILCLNCFILRAEKEWKVTGWILVPDWKWIKK